MESSDFRANAREGRWKWFPRLPGAATAKEAATMFGIDTDHDPINPSTTELLEELGLNVHAVRETLSEDFVRRCPDRAAATDQR